MAHPLTKRWGQLTLATKVALLVTSTLVAAIAVTALATYRVARSALQAELIASGKQTAADFARVDALEFLDPEKGMHDLELHLGQLVRSEERSSMRGGVALEAKGQVLATAGMALPSLSAQTLSKIAGPTEIPAVPGTITVAAPVVYSGVRLGYVVFALDRASLARAGSSMLRDTTGVLGGFAALNTLLVLLLLRRVLRPVEQLGIAAEAIAAGDYKARIADELAEDEIGRAARSFNKMASALELHMRFSNAALVDRIRRGFIDRAQEHQLAIVFGDARGYTSWSQKRTPQEIFDTLTRYYTCIGKIAVKGQGGIIDKFMGDGVLMHFGLLGTPTQMRRVSQIEARAAIRSTVYAQVALRIVAWALETFEERPPLEFRFGIASGTCLVGPVGAADVLLDYSLIGPTVNLASRLEALAPAGGVVIDRFTYVDAEPSFLDVLNLGEQPIKGFDRPIQVFGVRGFQDPAEVRAMGEFLDKELFTDSFIQGCILGGKGDATQVARVRARLREEIRAGALPVNAPPTASTV